MVTAERNIRGFPVGWSLVVAGMVASLCACRSPAARAGASRGSTGGQAAPHFSRYAVVDTEQHGVVVGTWALPEGWVGSSQVVWDYSGPYNPGKVSTRLASRDGSVWYQTFPPEAFFWLTGSRPPVRVGGRSLGMIYHPRINVQEALLKYVIGRYRAGAKDLQIVGYRRIANLAKTMVGANVPGDSLAARVHYTEDGHAVDEELVCWLGREEVISGEHHRVLAFAQANGARDGKLDGYHPILGMIARSFRPNPAWAQLQSQISAQITARFNRNLARGYREIAAAGAMSRRISAQNDASIRRMEAQRAAANMQRRQEAARSSAAFDDSTDDEDQYLRGTERVADPYWGTAERSYNSEFHWTDGFGNYEDTNDPNYDPNQHSNVQMQRMEPVR